MLFRSAVAIQKRTMTRIMVRFWIATAILCACGFVLYYAYFSKFNSLAS